MSRVARRFVRWGVLGAGLAAAVVVVLLGLAHSPPAQRAISQRLIEAVEEATGLELRLEDFDMPLLFNGVEVSAFELRRPGGALVASSARVRVRWSWIDLAVRRRIELISIQEPVIDVDEVRALGGDGDTGGRDGQFELGKLEVIGLRAHASGPPVSVDADDLQMTGTVRGGGGRLTVAGGALDLDRDGRRVRADAMGFEAALEDDVLTLEAFDLVGPHVELSAAGRLELRPSIDGRLDGRVTVDPALVGWWTGDDTIGGLVSGRVEGPWALEIADGGLAGGRFRHEGPEIQVPAFVIRSLEAELTAGPAAVVRVEGPNWGGVTVEADGDGFAARAAVERWSPLPVMALLAPDVALPEALGVPGLTGTAELRGAWDLTPENFVGRADLRARARDVTASLAASLDRGRIRIERASATFPGGTAQIAGRADAEGDLDLQGAAEVHAPGLSRSWIEALTGKVLPELHAERIRTEAELVGRLSDPQLRVEVSMQEPALEGLALHRVDGTLVGGRRAADWSVRASGDHGLEVVADGVAGMESATGSGVVTARIEQLGPWLERLPEGMVPIALDASGLVVEADLEMSELGLRGAVDMTADRVSAADLTARAVIAGFDIRPDQIVMSALELGILDGHVSAQGAVGTDDPWAGEVRVEWADIDTGALVSDPRAAGRISGRMELSGTPRDPDGEGWFRWVPLTPELPPIEARTTIAAGVATVRMTPWHTAAGRMTAEGEIPIRALLTDDGGAAPILASVTVDEMSAAGAASLTGLSSLDGDLQGRLTASVQWRPDLGPPQIQGTLEDGAITGPLGRFTFEEDVSFGFDGAVVRLSDTVITGDNTTAILGGTVDLERRAVDLAAHVRIAPDLGAVLPIPVMVRTPITLETRLRGPLERLEGMLRLDHEGGSIRMRDPAVQASNLNLDVAFVDGVAAVRSGSMTLNQGHVDIGGGWDPKTGQGIVFDVDRVTALLPMDILTRWSGTLAVEPAPGRLARVVGEIELDGGLWDEDVDLASFILGGPDEAAVEALGEIELDLEVRSRGAVRVDNNLGIFDVRWSGLEIRGTAAEPVVRGTLRILPGGQVQVGGSVVRLKRGTLRFTGDPLTDPVMDLVPEDSLLAASGESDGTNASAAVTQGLATGLGSVLGFDNETIPMSEISAETDTDTSTEFAIGRQLTSSVALFLTTDLRDAQSRTTVFQVWRLPTFPGLRFQAKTKTDTGESDLRATQTFRWGGTEGTAERPRIRVVRFRGDWPVRTWGLGRVTGLASGEPLDSFQLLAAEVRLERRLAQRGWPEATVTAELAGPPERPTIVFRCDAGPRVSVDFEGDGIPTKLERRAVSQYRFPPGETLSLRAIEGVIAGGLRARGFADPHIAATSLGDGRIVVDVAKGSKDTVEGPTVVGLPETLEYDVVARLGAPAEIRAVADDPERGERLVRKILAAQGFRDPDRVEVVVASDADAVRTVRVEVEPGEAWRIGSTSVTGSDPLELGTRLTLPAGTPVDRGRIEALASGVRRRYRAEGWSEADVATEITTDEATGDAVVRWIVDPGVRTRLDGIEVEGLRHLDRALVERALERDESGTVSLEELDEAAGRLSTFPPVERVELTTEQTSVAGRRIVVNVDEKPRWGVEVGGSWNSDFGLGFRGGVRDDNLFGRGLSLYLGGRWQEQALDSRMVLSLPPRPGGRMGLGLTLEYSETPRPIESIIDIEVEDHVGQVTFDARWEVRRSSLLRGYIRFSRTRTVEIEPADPEFPIDDVSKLGIVGAQWITDLLDNPIDPRSGTYIAVDLSTATEVLGSDSQHVRLLLTGSMVTEPWRDVTWMQTLRLGGSEPLGGTELFGEGRFRAGGPATIRGFEIDTVGPALDLGEAVLYLGGGALFILNEELRFPVWQDLRGAIFADIGQVWPSWSEVDSELAVGAGIGIRWGTPVGPLWVDAAWPVADRGRNEGARYSFGIGRTF
jgi:outer membrane protein assembly factor BamA